ncbi:kinase-like domain-containing protein [Xylariaceae sp. FL0594]|nr:kinase-like domain-containing protein [Xylariaceae sp. FL0594]
MQSSSKFTQDSDPTHSSPRPYLGEDHEGRLSVKDEATTTAALSPTQPFSPGHVEARLAEADGEVVTISIKSSTQPFSPGHIEALLAEENNEVETDAPQSSTPHSASKVGTVLTDQDGPLDLAKLSIESLKSPDPSCRVIFLPKFEGINVVQNRGTTGFDNWIQVNDKDDGGNSVSSSTVKFLSIAPDDQHLGFAVHCDEHDLAVNFFFDPSFDRLVLQNKGHSPVLATRKGAAGDHPFQPTTVMRASSIALSLGVWSLGTEQQPCLAELKVLERFPWPVTTSLSAKRTTTESASTPKRGRLEDGLVEAKPSGTLQVSSEGNALLSLANRETVRIGTGTDSYQLMRLADIANQRKSTVWRGRHSKVVGRDIVVKVVKAGSLFPDDTIRAAHSWAQELDMHSSLKTHSAVLPILGADARFHSIYTEHIEAKALPFHSNLADGSYNGTVADVRRILTDMASALSFVHAAEIVHNDVKPANILYHPDRGAVLIDFGLSFKKGRSPMSGGSPWYLAPEFLTNFNLRGPKSDMWALGVVMLWLLKKIRLPERSSKGWVIADIHLPGRSKPRTDARAAMEKWTELIATHASRLRQDPLSIEGIVKSMLEIDPTERSDALTALNMIESEGKGNTTSLLLNIVF